MTWLPSEDRWEGASSHPARGFVMPSVSHKNPEAPWEENPLWESAGGDRSDNSPWKAGSSESEGTKTALARQVGRGSPHRERPVPMGCGHPTSGSSAPSTRSQASGQARGNGQATITGLFFQLKPNPRVHFCHPASNRSVTVRNE